LCNEIRADDVTVCGGDRSGVVWPNNAAGQAERALVAGNMKGPPVSWMDRGAALWLR